jgi:hypothetical protein
MHYLQVLTPDLLLLHLPPQQSAFTEHGLPLALQVVGTEPRQTPLEHWSFVVAALPSLQAVPLALNGFEQTPVAVLHVPTVWHWSRAVQTTGFDPVHTPDWQVSVFMHALPSLHNVPSGTSTSIGQIAEVPLHVSILSHWSIGARQVVVGGLKTFTDGQVAEFPVHFSCRSQSPAAARQTVVDTLKLGRQVPLPLQVSGLSHTVSAELPHGVPCGSKQLSAVSLHVRAHSAPAVHGLPA